MKNPWKVGGFGNRPSLRWQNLTYALKFYPLIPKLIKNYGRVIAGKRVLRGVEFAITYRCNFECPHCLKKYLIDSSQQELSKDEIIDAARQIEKLGGIFINYTGGEPILREDIYEIVEETAKTKGLIVTLASNAYALDEEKIAQLKRLGLAILTLSLDAATADVHNNFRRQVGSFAKVIEAVKTAKKCGLDVWLNAIATKEIIKTGELARLAELANNLGCMLTLNLPYPVGGWQNKDISLSPEEYKIYLKTLKLPNVRWEGSSNWLIEGCPAGVEKVYITPYGDVFPCAVIHTAFGNIKREPLAVIYERMGKISDYDGRKKPCLVAEDSELMKRYK